MSRIREMPRSGALRRSSRHPVQRGFGASPGRRNSFAIMPSYVPSGRSTNRNQPTGLRVSSSVFCHRPTAEGSAACAGETANSPRLARAVRTIKYVRNERLHLSLPPLSKNPGFRCAHLGYEFVPPIAHHSVILAARSSRCHGQSLRRDLPLPRACSNIEQARTHWMPFPAIPIKPRVPIMTMSSNNAAGRGSAIDPTAGQIGMAAAVSIGIGGMIGAGIFSILGVVAHAAGNAMWLSFALGGVVALLSTYSYAKLGAAFPSAGGAVHFLVKGFGDGVLAGGLNLFMWGGYIISPALFPPALRSYAPTLLPQP